MFGQLKMLLGRLNLPKRFGEIEERLAV